MFRASEREVLLAAAANFINGRNGIAVRRRDEGSDPSAACGRCSGENGAALPVADIASRFQGSAPFSGHEGAHWTDGTTRANAVTKFWAPQQDHAALRNGLVNAVGADAHIDPHEMVRKMCVGAGFYPARSVYDGITVKRRGGQSRPPLQIFTASAPQINPGCVPWYAAGVLCIEKRLSRYLRLL